MTSTNTHFPKMLLLLPLAWMIASTQSSNKVCPGSSFSCPDSATCCELSDKSYGCCPLENAVCCDDHIHCCPHETKCSPVGCIRHDGLNVTAKRLSSNDKNTHCLGTKYVCPNSFTCCKTLEPDTYGCCPDGTICDVKKGMCLGKDYISEMYDFQKTRVQVHGFAKFLPLNKPKNVSSVVCPGSSFTCPNGYTCCKLPSGDWGCCPFVKATCCKDHLHCCPQNMQCDSRSRSCSRGQISVPSLLKELSKPINVGRTCPDNSTCAESMTCCELNNKHFGCCPYTDAVCCEDHSHCCPHDYICDVVDKNCIPKQKVLYNVISKYYKKLE